MNGSDKPLLIRFGQRFDYFGTHIRNGAFQ